MIDDKTREEMLFKIQLYEQTLKLAESKVERLKEQVKKLKQELKNG